MTLQRKVAIASLSLLIPIFVVGCGQKNPVISELPKADQTQINKAINGDGAYKLPTSLPFVPTHGEASVSAQIGRVSSSSLELHFNNDNQVLVIHEANGSSPVPNQPDTAKLSNGIPVQFTDKGGVTELYWTDGSEGYSLSSNATSKNASALTKDQLVKIANSMGT